jgi:hypothetical protein
LICGTASVRIEAKHRLASPGYRSYPEGWIAKPSTRPPFIEILYKEDPGRSFRPARVEKLLLYESSWIDAGLFEGSQEVVIVGWIHFL